MKRLMWVGFMISMLIVPEVFALEEVKLQRAVPQGILNRVFPLKYKKETGTCFVIDIDERQYIVTARHLVPEVKVGDQVQVFTNQEWKTLKIKPIIPENTKTDIIALAANKIIAPKMQIVAGDDGILVGQDVYFLGFPFGLATRFDKPSPVQFAFIKKAILSAIDARPESGHILYLDGHNNPGFSGGPVIFANYNKGDRLQIAGVVAGYRNQPTQVMEAEVEASQSNTGKTEKRVIHYIRENTGIVISYSLSEITKAISTNPIGCPILPSTK